MSNPDVIYTTLALSPSIAIYTYIILYVQTGSIVLFISLQYSGWNIISIGLNFVMILIFNDVGLLSKVRSKPYRMQSVLSSAQ